jgi:predicted Rossmann-fold nucleotide-binding protein
MSRSGEGTLAEYHAGKQPLVVRVTDADFQRDVLEKLGRLEAKMDMLIGGGQPGRMKLAEDRLSTLEHNDIRRSVYDRLVNAAIAVVIIAAIAMHDHLGIK